MLYSDLMNAYDELDKMVTNDENFYEVIVGFSKINVIGRPSEIRAQFPGCRILKEESPFMKYLVV